MDYRMEMKHGTMWFQAGNGFYGSTVDLMAPCKNYRGWKSDNSDKTEFSVYINSFYDAIQDVIETAIKNRKSILFESQGKFENAVRKLAKKRINNAHQIDEMHTALDLWDIEQSFDVATKGERKAVLNESKAFGCLNKQQRRYLERYLNGGKNKEICLDLGISERRGRYIKLAIVRALKEAAQSKSKVDNLTMDYRNDPMFMHSVDLTALKYRSFSKPRSKSKK